MIVFAIICLVWSIRFIESPFPNPLPPLPRPYMSFIKEELDLFHQQRPWPSGLRRRLISDVTMVTPGSKSTRDHFQKTFSIFFTNWRQKFSKSISGIVCPENQLFSASNAQKTSYFQHLMLRKPANFQHSMPWKPMRKFPLLLYTNVSSSEIKAYNGENDFRSVHFECRIVLFSIECRKINFRELCFHVYATFASHWFITLISCIKLQTNHWALFSFILGGIHKPYEHSKGWVFTKCPCYKWHVLIK